MGHEMGPFENSLAFFYFQIERNTFIIQQFDELKGGVIIIWEDLPGTPSQPRALDSLFLFVIFRFLFLPSKLLVLYCFILFHLPLPLIPFLSLKYHFHMSKDTLPALMITDPKSLTAARSLSSLSRATAILSIDAILYIYQLFPRQNI